VRVRAHEMQRGRRTHATAFQSGACGKVYAKSRTKLA
jgi:hypothetical protein